VELLKKKTPNDLVDWIRFALWRSEARDDEQESSGKWNLIIDDMFEPDIEEYANADRAWGDKYWIAVSGSSVPCAPDTRGSNISYSSMSTKAWSKSQLIPQWQRGLVLKTLVMALQPLKIEHA